MYTLRGDYENVLGTFLSVRLTARHESAALESEQGMWQEIDRLMALLHPFDASSEVSRWMRGEVAQPSSELTEVLARAEEMRQQTAGAFHVGVAEFSHLWRVAEQTGVLPSSQELQEIASQLQQPISESMPGTYTQPFYRVNLSALAKGYIVDKAAIAALRSGALGVRLNVGGEIVHRGKGNCIAEVDHPLSSSQTAARIKLCNQAMASSGHRLRGFLVGGQRYSHLIDPRTGLPVTAGAGVTVVASDCLTADAWATALCILEPREALKLSDECDVAALIFDASGKSSYSSRSWARLCDGSLKATFGHVPIFRSLFRSTHSHL